MTKHFILFSLKLNYFKREAVATETIRALGVQSTKRNTNQLKQQQSRAMTAGQGAQQTQALGPASEPFQAQFQCQCYFPKHKSSILWRLHLHILHLHFLPPPHTDKISLFHPCSVPTLRPSLRTRESWINYGKSLKITKPAYEFQLCHDCFKKAFLS